MISKSLLLISCCLSSVILLFGQCPEKQALYKRIIFLRDSARLVPASQKLTELLEYESRVKTCPYQPDSTHALLLQRIGAAYFAQAEFSKAIDFTLRSVNILQANSDKPSANDRFLFKDYANLIIFYGAANDFQRQRIATDSCIAIGRNLPKVEEPYLIALGKKVEYLFYSGDYSFCYSYATIGEAAARKYYDYNRTAYLLSFLNWKVTTLISDKKFDQAEQHLLAASKEALDADAKNYLGAIYEQLAEAITYKDPAKALRFFKLALSYDKSTGNDLGCMQTLNNLGYNFYFKQQGDLRKALFVYKEALNYGAKKKAGKPEKWESLNVLANIAGLYVQQGLYDSAFCYFQLSFDQVATGINEKNLPDSLLESFLNNGDAQYLTNLVIDKADAFLARYNAQKDPGDITTAINIYKYADRLLDKIKTNSFELESKLTWRMNSRRLYEHAIEACYRDKRTTDAFYFFEKSRATLLSDQLTEQNLVSPKDIFLQKQLQQTIAEKERALKLIDNTDRAYMPLFDTIVNLKQKLFGLQQAIKKRNPLYYQHFIDSSFVQLTDVQHTALKDHAALIEIHEGDSAVYTLIITTGTTDFARISKPAFDSAVKLFTGYLSNATFLNQHFTAFVNTAGFLYKLVFKDGAPPPGRIIISPDKLYFPFEALVMSRDNKRIDYFVNTHAVSYTYSSRYLLNQFNSGEQTGSRDFLGIAPVDYPQQWKLASLRDCDVSLKQIQGYFRTSEIQLFDAATKNNFMKDFARYKIIQLYTHATDHGNFGEPVIYFADSVLHLSELIGGEKPVTGLIVLSACYTGTGKLHIGEGIFSFNRGFASLGIPAAVTSLWAADKISVLKLTDYFYKYLSMGAPTDVALQQAKLEFLKNASDKSELPFYWAGTILVGKSGTISYKKPVPWRMISLLSGGILLIGIVFYKIKKYRS